MGHWINVAHVTWNLVFADGASGAITGTLKFTSEDAFVICNDADGKDYMYAKEVFQHASLP